MKTKTKCKRGTAASRIATCLGAAVIAFVSAGSAFAAGYGLFELDGNAVDVPSGLPDDWSALYNGGTNDGGTRPPLFVFTTITADPAPLSIFDGGKKDIQDIGNWSGKDGSVPDKDDITDAYAAGYHCLATSTGCTEGDLIVTFGADRFSNVGDAFMGFWFFKDEVSYDPATGEFSGSHMNGDTLVLVDFPQGANASPLIQVVKWDTSCSKAANNNPQPTQCAAQNLRLIASSGAVCDGGDADFCAITNHQTEISPWSYTSKNPDTNGCPDSAPYCFPFETFYEGAINLTQVVGENCFASFMAETRSSESFTASLKDFVIDQFPVCRVEISKSCGTGAVNQTTGNLEIPYTVTINNTGGAGITAGTVTDDNCGGLGGSDQTLTFGPISSGSSQNLTGTCVIAAGTTIPTSGVVNGASAVVTDPTGTPVLLASSCVTDSSHPGVCYDACSFNLSPQIDVTKFCKTKVVAQDDVVKVKVHYYGTVTNTSDQTSYPVGLHDVNVTETHVTDDSTTPPTTTTSGALPLCTDLANPATCATSVSLNPGDSRAYEGYYYPSTLNDECPSKADFSDTASTSGKANFTNASVSDGPEPAHCKLCADGECPTN